MTISLNHKVFLFIESQWPLVCTEQTECGRLDIRLPIDKVGSGSRIIMKSNGCKIAWNFPNYNREKDLSWFMSLDHLVWGSDMSDINRYKVLSNDKLPLIWATTNKMISNVSKCFLFAAIISTFTGLIRSCQYVIAGDTRVVQTSVVWMAVRKKAKVTFNGLEKWFYTLQFTSLNIIRLN